MVLAVELVQLVEEACGDAVLVVKLDGALDRGVADYIPMREVLGNDARPRFLFLCDLVRVTVGVGGHICVGVVRAGARCGRHADVRRAQLGVVEEEGGLGGGVLLCQWCQLLNLWYGARSGFPKGGGPGQWGISLPNVTVADLVSPSVFTSRLVILPLASTLATT